MNFTPKAGDIVSSGRRPKLVTAVGEQFFLYRDLEVDGPEHVTKISDEWKVVEKRKQWVVELRFPDPGENYLTGVPVRIVTATSGMCEERLVIVEERVFYS